MRARTDASRSWRGAASECWCQWDTYSDLWLGAPGHVNRNDIGVTDDPLVPLSSEGKLNVNPGIAGILSYRLAPHSLLVDAGVVRAGAALPSSDLDGSPRIYGAQIDIGACGLQVLLSDAFESGNVQHWSSVTP